MPEPARTILGSPGEQPKPAEFDHDPIGTARAAQMYPDMVKQPNAPQAPAQPATDPRSAFEIGEALEDKLYGPPESDPARSKYRELMPEIQHTADLARRSDSAGEIFKESAAFFRRHQFEVGEARTFQRAVLHGLQNPLTDDQKAKQEAGSLRDLRAEFGSDFEPRLKLAKEYIASNPGLSQVLDSSGAGSDLEVCRVLLRKIPHLVGEGRIRRKTG